MYRRVNGMVSFDAKRMEPNMLAKVAYTVPEFLAAHGIGRTKFYELLNRGEIKARRTGGRTIITAADAQAWLNSLPQVEPKTAA